jgi:adenine deaminase
MIDLDLLLYNADIVDVFRLRVFAGWAGVKDGRWVYVEEGAPPAGVAAAAQRDLAGMCIAPGLVDAHMHIESSQIPPASFARAVLPHGTTTVLADAHEVANVAGEDGGPLRIELSAALKKIYGEDDGVIVDVTPAQLPEKTQ